MVNPLVKRRKVMITCAVTGAIHTPTMSPHLPITAEEIAEAAIAAHEAGAALVHLHARDPVDGRPDQRPEAFEPFLKEIKQASDVVINITTGGAPTMSVEERLEALRALQARGRLAQHGLDELRPVPDARRASRSSSFDWERPYLEGSDDRIFKNTFGTSRTS